MLQRKADVNAPQIDGTTALHWAVRVDDLETADLLIRAGAKVSAANRAGATPMQLAALNGNAADARKAHQGRSGPECPADAIWRHGAHDGVPHREADAIKVLLDSGAQVNAKETWGGTTALMWAVSERHRLRSRCSSTTARTSMPVPISSPRPTAAASKDGRRRLPSPIKPWKSLPAAG